MPVFCRHNRYTAECPICAKGTVLDPNLKPSRSRSAGVGNRRKTGGGSRSGPAAPQISRGVFAAAGPYDDGREVRLEKVPGGLRLASWHAGTLVRGAPVVALDDLAGLLAEAAELKLIDLPALDEQPATTAGGYGASSGRSGDLRDELRVERLDGDRLRIARWVMRPNRGWELQEAPVLLPAGRFVQALEAAAGQGVLASESEG